MKYKVGDKVRVKSKEELLDIYKNPLEFKNIEEYCGTIVTISAVNEDYLNMCYDIKEDNGRYFWYDRDFAELVETVETKTKITKLLLVEDGSVDVDDLTNEFDGTNIKVVVLRKGAMKPILIDLEK